MTDVPHVHGDLVPRLHELERRLRRLRAFHLGYVPYVTTALIALLVGVYVFWQGGQANSAQALLEQGAKNRALIVELRQAWRLLTANLLHASTWHLAVNAFFLLNIGGAAEAVFRRADYLVILLGAALGTTLLSSLLSTQTSCGASGLVFGAWGAISAFGVRHKRVLPERYRRYFLGLVLPFLLFVLYVGLATPGVDTFGHLGGLLAGAVLGWLLPPRLSPAARRPTLKLMGMTGVALQLMLVPQALPPRLELTSQTLGALTVPVLARATATARTQRPEVKAAAFDNGAGVIVAFEERPADHALEQATRRFVLEDLGPELERAGAQGMRISPARPATLAGHRAQRLDTDVFVGGAHTRTSYVVSVVDGTRYVVSVSAPAFLWPRYTEALEAALQGVRLTQRGRTL